MRPSSNLLRVLAVLLGSAALSASAADLRLYSSFSEVRGDVSATSRTFTLTLPQDVWQNMIPGTLGLDGLSFTSAVQAQQDTWLKSLEGQRVTLRENGKRSPVTLIRAADLLIRDAAGEYRTVSYAQLSFPSPPPLGAQLPSQSILFRLKAAGKGVVSYLTRGLSWTPRYTLQVTSGTADRAALRALADIRNATTQAYRVSSTELFAGEVKIESDGVSQTIPPLSGYLPLPAVPIAGAAMSSPVPLDTINGLYRYGLNTAYVLQPRSTLTLPFLTPKLSSFLRYATLDSSFSPLDSQGVLDRSYRLKADQNLPGGIVTVREAGRIVGQASMPDTARNREIRLTLGRDPDLSYTRHAETLGTTPNNGGTYRVTYVFTSNKDRAFPVEVREQIDGRKVLLDGLKAQNQVIVKRRIEVAAHGTARVSFTVIINNDD
ncbi:hypothetical protein [Deinococcus ruber]|uniref:DUF4139 domain-containing protein n=1 Tax=Deinococcus ruber TaxID=1848197 RepID=A0A918C257_9DEIO|nr:hypothetical protein [Deinococcus ruber]GGR01135.1 hypothetical protein GCM10008957_12570 [Deinococcus ruber]